MTATLAPTAQADAGTLRFWSFAAMWAIADLMHLLNQGLGRLDSVPAWANLIAAFYLLARPSSADRLALLAITQLVFVAAIAPLAPDHLILAAWCNIVLLVAYVRLRRSSGVVTGSELIASALGALRVLLLVAYTAAAIAKYNSEFFDPVVSCAPFLADVATFGLLGEDSPFGWLHVAAAVVPETAIPILLVIPATRRYGVRFGILFHFLVSASLGMAVRDFTATLFALFPLFLSEAEIARLVGRWRAGRESRRRGDVRDMVLTIPRRVRWVGLTLLAGAAGWLSIGFFLLIVYLAFTVYGVRIVMLAFRTIRPAGATRTRLATGIRPSQLAIAGAMVLYVSMPYLGLRTTGVFTMFSNLRTEGPGTNHFFMPSVHVVDVQNDLVVFVDSDVERFEDLGEDGQQIPRFEVRRELTDDPDRYVIESTASGEVRLGAGGQPVDAPPFLARKFLHFRAIAAEGDHMCTN